MTRADKVAEARNLRGEGLKLREIAERMDSKVSTVHTWLSDPDLSKQRARRESYRGRCENCGRATDGSSGRAHAPTRCRTCEEHRNDERNARVIAAWTAGDPGDVIAAREGMTEAAVFSLVDVCRRLRGVEVPRHKRAHRELWPLIERRWNEGATSRQIAQEAGTTPENITFMVSAMRRAGVDLPYRLPRKAAA